MSNTLFAPPAAPDLSLAPIPPAAPEAWSATLGRSYDRHGAAAFGLAERVTRNAEVAAQLTAEVFGSLHSVTDEDTLAECLLTEIHRRAVAWVREFSPTSSSGLSNDALAVLPRTEREVIAAAYFGGQTYDDIASTLGLQLEQVATLMRMGLRRLSALSPQSPAA